MHHDKAALKLTNCADSRNITNALFVGHSLSTSNPLDYKNERLFESKTSVNQCQNCCA